MSYKVKFIPKFEKELKRLAKKYPSLKADFSQLLITIKHDPTQGTSLGNECYKIRMAIASKGKGKSGGARVITYVYVTSKIVYLLSIYDKAEQDNLSDKEINTLLKLIP